MALREIIIWPDPRLKGKAKPVGEVDASVRKLCDDMAETMYDANGVGLAAPQIGVLQNVIAIDVEQRSAEGRVPQPEGGGTPTLQPKKKGEGLFWLIDPVLKLGEGEFTYTEGCLSIPDEYEEVTRFGHIVVEFTGRDGKRRQLEADNTLLSVCVQHEMDHLQGKLFVDHLSALKRELIRRRMKKLKAQREAERKGEATAL
jgi:peptide deformylase